MKTPQRLSKKNFNLQKRKLWIRSKKIRCWFKYGLKISKNENEKKPLCFINPQIKTLSEKMSTYEEGCLSIPNTFIEIERPEICTVSYIDENGDKKEMECDGLLSTCLQHEINHLDGKLIIDYLSKIKKDLIIKKLSKQKTSNRVVV